MPLDQSLQSASSSSPSASSSTWYCHECNRDGQPLRVPEPQCQYCHSSFIEELDPSQSLSSLRQWSLGRSDPDPYPYDDSPPIPGTRQRYEQLLRDADRQPTHHSNQLFDPLLNIFGIHPAPNQHHPAHDPVVQPTSSPSRQAPTQAFNLPGFLRPAQDPTHSTPPRPPTQDAPQPMPGQFPGGLAGGTYTFTFDSRSPTPVFGFQPAPGTSERPASAGAHEPDRAAAEAQPALQGLFSLLQNAFGLAGTPGNEGASNSGPTDEQRSRADAHEHTGPTPASPGVPLEPGHPLRQFIDLLGTLSRPDGRDGGANFTLNGGFGHAAFGFGGPGGHIGDYVTSERGMQDILDQLMSMAGTGARAPAPASDGQIASLKRFKFESSKLGDEPGECAICKDSFAEQDECMELPCKHFFHAEDCIGTWLKQSGTCPVCRYSLVEDRPHGRGEHEGRATGGDERTGGSPPTGERTRRTSEDHSWGEEQAGSSQLEPPFDVD